MATVVGDNFTQSENRREILPEVIPDHWYYVANTYEQNGNSTIINSYLADLTAGETTLVRVLHDLVASGTMATYTPLGIGAYYSGSDYFQAWSGSLNEIAFYNQTLDINQIQAHLDALFETAPSGDFNGDGIVDLADYTMWRDNLGASEDSSILNGNGNGGLVDATDYALWKSNFRCILFFNPLRCKRP